jgi:fatty-acyl-CoA synthase
MLGAVINALNTRLDPAMVAFILNHSQSDVIIVDTEFAATVSICVFVHTCVCVCVCVNLRVYT